MRPVQELAATTEQPTLWGFLRYGGKPSNFPAGKA